MEIKVYSNEILVEKDSNLDDFIDKVNKVDLADIVYQEILQIKNNKVNKLKQGFIELENLDLLSQLDDILNDFYDQFVNNLILNIRFKKNMVESSKFISKKYDFNLNVSTFLSNFTSKLHSKIFMFYLSKFDSKIHLILSNLSIFDIIFLPQNVKKIYLKKQPKASLIGLLKNYKIDFIIVEKYQIKYIDFEYFETLIDLKTFNLPLFEAKKDHNLIEVGVSISDISEISKVFISNPSYIYIEPEKSYIKNNGLIDKESRISFYNELKSTYPNAKTVLSLPRLDTLYDYHQIDGDFTLTNDNYKKHFLMYLGELDAYLTVYKEQGNLAISMLTDAIEFKLIKNQILYWANKVHKSKINIGINIETDASFDFTEDYKKFDFAFFDMDRLYEEVNIHNDFNDFIQEISYVVQLLKIRRKDIYFTGIKQKEVKVFSRMLTRGFKKFTLDNYNINDNISLISKYLSTRGTHKKPKNQIL